MLDILKVVMLFGSLCKGLFNGMVVCILFGIVLVGMDIFVLLLIGDILLYDVDMQEEEGFLQCVQEIV